MLARKISLFVAVCLVSSAALAEDTKACIDAHGRAQELLGKRDLVAARAELAGCVQTSCPAMIRSDCGRFMDEVDARIPTVVFFLRKAGGDDVVDAKVTIDGKLVLTRLDGSSVAVNPGSHEFRFELPDGRSFDKKLVLREGERLRQVGLELAPAPEPEKAPPSPPVTPPRSTHTERSAPAAASESASVVPYVLAGVGVLGLASFSYFGLSGRATQKDLERCSPSCDNSRRDDFDGMRREFLIADISLGVGVAALAGASVLFLTRTESSEGSVNGSLALGVTASGIRASGSF